MEESLVQILRYIADELATANIVSHIESDGTLTYRLAKGSQMTLDRDFDTLRMCQDNTEITSLVSLWDSFNRELNSTRIKQKTNNYVNWVGHLPLIAFCISFIMILAGMVAKLYILTNIAFAFGFISVPLAIVLCVITAFNQKKPSDDAIVMLENMRTALATSCIEVAENLEAKEKC